MTKPWDPHFPFSPARLPFFYGWVIVFGATLGTLFSIPGQTMGFSVFTELLLTELGLTRLQLSTAYFIGTLASGLTLPWLGQILDAWGARRMVVASSVVTGLVLFYLSRVAWLCARLAGDLPPGGRTAVSFGAIVLGFFLIRASAQGVLTLTCRNAIGKWFNVKRGIAVSVSQVIISFGFSYAPVLLSHWIDRWGYEGAWAFLGILTLGVMAPVGWLIFRDNPEECGLLMDGTTGPAPPSTNEDMRMHRDFTRPEAVRTLSFWAFNLSFSFFAFFATAFTFHIVSLGQEFGFAKESIIRLFVPIALASVCTNLVCGLINTRIRIKHLLILMNGAATLGAIGLFKLDHSWGVLAYVIGNGITGGAFVNLSAVVWPRFFGRRHLGAISGVSMSSMVIASAVGPIAFGLAEELTGTYAPALIASIFLPAGLALVSFFADNPQRDP